MELLSLLEGSELRRAGSPFAGRGRDSRPLEISFQQRCELQQFVEQACVGKRSLFSSEGNVLQDMAEQTQAGGIGVGPSGPEELTRLIEHRRGGWKGWRLEFPNRSIGTVAAYESHIRCRIASTQAIARRSRRSAL